MGQKNQKATPVQTREPIEIKVDLKRIWRLLDTEFKINQAKQALKYNDDQVAKQFLQIALNKIKVSLNFLRMANRVLFLEQEVKSTQANADLMYQLNVVTPILLQYVNNHNKIQIKLTELQMIQWYKVKQWIL